MPQADSKNSSGQEQQQTAQTFQNPYSYPQNFEDDTIDLYELCLSLWKRRWLVIALTVVVALGSIVYSLQLQLIYKAEALLLPPQQKDVEILNFFPELETEEKKEISTSDVFAKYKQNLNSRTLHRKFILEYGLMEYLAPNRNPETRDENIYQGFAKLIKLRIKDGITALSIELHDSEIAAQWVNDLIEFVDKETISMMVEDSQNSIANKIRDIEYTIASKRQMAKKRREDQIVRYDEATQIAKTLGIKRRVDATNIIQNTQMNVDIATATTPLYYLGVDALKTEIKTLRNRASDDPFIGGLRDLQERLALLNSIKFDKAKLSSVHVDQAAYPSNSPIKPDREMIISIATVAGLFSGILLAFFIEFVHNQRKKHSK